MSRPWVTVPLLLCVTALAAAVDGQDRLVFRWPTPNRAWEEGRPIDAYIQATVSGDPESGTFGCIRSGGTQFHEGIDIKAISHDRRGEPADPVSAAMDGVVRYVNARPGVSNYGRYIVLEHPDLTPAVYTLYAHLARIEPGVRPGTVVKAGDVIALMGRSEGSMTIPKDRAHVHFEIGLRLSDAFDGWYSRRRFGSPNEHGVWNGMNLMGIDPLDFLRQWRFHRVAGFQQYFDNQRPAVRVRVWTRRTPDFIQRYPSLLRKPVGANLGLISGWEVDCDWTGLPFGWTPLYGGGGREGEVQVVSVDSAALQAHRCKALVHVRHGAYVPAGDLETTLQLVFGID